MNRLKKICLVLVVALVFPLVSLLVGCGATPSNEITGIVFDTMLYEDGVAVDLEIIEKIDIAGSEFFHMDDIKLYDYNRNEKLSKEFALKDDMYYQISRLFLVV